MTYSNITKEAQLDFEEILMIIIIREPLITVIVA